ncbi:hypothetical protein RJ639_038478 [Escallonia herrerae]|uniref:Uncharacterized protein n=1 Tax=Escallonia herrerae TaxID=1293975 RepID=A0AA88WMQ0_9ASTE|nr:hypothetical protein RJ639_038478 [Escallonia herrerae]
MVGFVMVVGDLRCSGGWFLGFGHGGGGEEMMMFMDAFPETGLEPAVFAALVPNSADKPLRELVEEIIGDHEMLFGDNNAVWVFDVVWVHNVVRVCNLYGASKLV